MKQPFIIDNDKINNLFGLLFTGAEDKIKTILDNATDAQISSKIKEKEIIFNKINNNLYLCIKYNGIIYKILLSINENKIIEYYKNEFDWYRIWSDGSIEQGGNCAVSGGYGTVTLLKPLTDIKYRPILTQSHGIATVPYIYADIVAVHEQTTTGFGIIVSDNFDGPVTSNIGWYLYGK